MRCCTTHTLNRSKLWQPDHCQHPQNGLPQITGTCPEWWKQSFQLQLWSLVWFQVRATSCHLTSSKPAWKSIFGQLVCFFDNSYSSFYFMNAITEESSLFSASCLLLYQLNLTYKWHRFWYLVNLDYFWKIHIHHFTLQIKSLKKTSIFLVSCSIYWFWCSISTDFHIWLIYTVFNKLLIIIHKMESMNKQVPNTILSKYLILDIK